MFSEKEITEKIKTHWANLTGCTIPDFESGITMISDSKNTKLSNTRKIHEEIQVLSYKNGGTIVNVPDECVPSLSKIIQEYGMRTRLLFSLSLPE